MVPFAFHLMCLGENCRVTECRKNGRLLSIMGRLLYRMRRAGFSYLYRPALAHFNMSQPVYSPKQVENVTLLTSLMCLL
jgi:hypothetical protein